MSIPVLIRLSNTNLNFSKIIFCEGVQLYFEIREIFGQNFNQYVTVYLVQILIAYDKADEKTHYFS